MDLRQLRHFVTVAEELHFGRAAARLAMTQPPLSQSIRALEEELGVALFLRDKRNVALTPAGAGWLPEARALLASAAGLPELARRLARGERGSLRLAFVSTADYSVLPPLVARFKAAFPDVDLALAEMTSDLQIEALLAETIDAGIVIALPRASLHPALSYRALTSEPLVAAVPRAWLDAGRIALARGRLRVEDAGGEPLIIFPRRIAPVLHDIVTGTFAKAGAAPRIGQEAIQMQTIISLVSAGMGLALVPRSLENLARSGVAYVPLEGDAPQIETGLLWRTQSPSPSVGRLVELA
nr:LysR family transcriptional regulator [Aureimonas populi]